MKRTLLTLFAAVLLLAAALLLDHHRDVSRTSDKFAFDTTEKGDIVSLRVILQKDTALLFKVSGEWMAAPDSFPADTAKMNKELSTLLHLQTKELVSTSPDRLSEYGLDTAEAKHVEWKTSGGKTYRVVIGKTSGIDYSSTYWKWEEQPDVYSTPGNFTWEIASRSSDWKDHALFALAPGEVKDIRVDWRDSANKVYQYKAEVVNDTGLKLVEPETVSVVKNLARQILSRFTQFTIDDFALRGDSNLSRAGLDTPRVDVLFDLQNGKSYEIKGGRAFSTMVYIQHPFRKNVVKLAPWRLEPFQKTPDQLSGKDTGQTAPKPARKVGKAWHR